MKNNFCFKVLFKWVKISIIISMAKLTKYFHNLDHLLVKLQLNLYYSYQRLTAPHFRVIGTTRGTSVTKFHELEIFTPLDRRQTKPCGVLGTSARHFHALPVRVSSRASRQRHSVLATAGGDPPRPLIPDLEASCQLLVERSTMRHCRTLQSCYQQLRVYCGHCCCGTRIGEPLSAGCCLQLLAASQQSVVADCS